MKYFILPLLFALQVVGATRIPATGVTIPSGTMLVGGAGNIGTTTPLGTINQVLTSQGGTSTPIWKNSSSGVKNYITTGDAESGTTGFSTYSDAAGVSPVDGTGGTAAISFDTTTGTPLAGTNSFRLVKGATNRQGDGVSYAFTIDEEDQTRMMEVKFRYNVSSGTFVAGSKSAASDVTVWIYDVTNGTLNNTPLSVNYLESNTTTSYGADFKATFQAPSNSKNYRLIFHVGSTSTSAYTLKFDSISVSPSVYSYGVPSTDCQPYTPAFTGFGTVAGPEFQWCQVADSVYIFGSFQTGTPTAVEARVSLPPGLTSDGNKVTSLKVVGGLFSGGAFAGSWSVLSEPDVSYMTFGIQGGSNAGYSKVIASTGFAASTTYSFWARIPITGWSSSVQMSDGSVGAQISSKSYTTTTQALNSTPSKIVNWASAFDRTGMISTANNRFNITSPGDYDLQVNAQLSSVTGGVLLGYRINGVTTNHWLTDSVNSDRKNGYGLIQNLKAGDYVEIYGYAGTSATLINSVSDTYFSLSRRASPQTTAANPVVTARYTSSSGQSIASGATSIIDFETRDFDNLGSVTTGAAWKFTAHYPGIYRVSSNVRFANGLAWTAGGYVAGLLYKNGSPYSSTDTLIQATNTFGTGPTSSTSTTVKLLAGDYIDLRATHNEASARALVAAGTLVWISIELVK